MEKKFFSAALFCVFALLSIKPIIGAPYSTKRIYPAQQGQISSIVGFSLHTQHTIEPQASNKFSKRMFTQNHVEPNAKTSKRIFPQKTSELNEVSGFSIGNSDAPILQSPRVEISSDGRSLIAHY